MFLFNLLLALAWLALTGQFTPLNFLVGLVLGYVIMAGGLGSTSSSYVARVGKIVRFALFFVWELIKASLRVAFDIVTPWHYMRPGVISIPLDLKNDAQITLLANLISLTPGTLSLDVSEDRRHLYIHAMYIDDVEQLRDAIKQGLERRVSELTQ